MGIRKVLACGLGIGALLSPAMPPASGDMYLGAATVVYKEEGRPPDVDSGAVVCNPSQGVGVGGACIPFGNGNSVFVQDMLSGQQVAFQVCIDNNGDGVCTSYNRPPSEPCPDIVVFSHDDKGNFFNPLGALPTGFPRGCESSKGFRGYVVLLCEGFHSAQGTPHQHPATTGIVQPAGFLDTPSGDFCGAGAGKESRVDKPYYII